jgi:hypothetical protein
MVVVPAGHAGLAGGDDRRHSLSRARHPGGAGHRCQGLQACTRGCARAPPRAREWCAPC